MLPRIIHYCWFGGNPLPVEAQKCIDSWKKYCPGYEIKEWNEANFDYHSCDYAREAYEAKKWAFVSDYARFWILYNYGGLYFDTDVELIKPIDDIIEKGPFMGMESDYDPKLLSSGYVAPGLGLAANPGLGLYKEILDCYERMHFKYDDERNNVKTVVHYTTEILVKHGLKNKQGIQLIDGVYIYPKEYFCPMDYLTYELRITENTRSIHHYAATWQTKKRHNTKKAIKKVLPPSVTRWIMKVKKTLRDIRK